VSWSAFTTPQNQAVAAGNLSAPIGADGFVSLNLTPNASALPAGSYYTAVYHLNDGTVNQEYWVVPSTSSATIAAVRAQLEPSTVAAMQGVSQAYVQSALASLSGSWLPLAGGAMSGPLTLNADPTAQNQAATKHYADQLAAADLPLSGGNVTGAISAQNATSKLPRVDITHPDFGAGCANGADRTGKLDSTCAILNAIAYIQTQCVLNACPTLYVPWGTFKVSNALRIPSNISVIGDGPQASVLQTTSPTANLLTFVGSVNPLAFFFGGVVRNIGLSGSGHTTTGTLLEEQGAPLSIENVLFYNHGGKGFVGFENTERSKLSDVQFLQVRQPEVIDGYEYRQSNVTIGSAGCAADNYCFGVNDINGVYPGPLPAADYTLISATGSGSSATFVFSGSQTGYPAGTSPLAVGHVLAVSGITGVTGLNSPSNQGWQVSAVANNSPSSGEFTLTVGATPLGQQISASGSGNVSAAAFSTALLPDNRHASIWISGGYNNSLIGGEIKPTTHLPAFKIMTANALEIDNFYVEGYVNPTQADLLFSGLPEQMIGNGTLQSSTSSQCSSGGFPCVSVTQATAQWWPQAVGIASDIKGIELQGMTVYVFPCDYVANSTSPSACNSSVQQGQWEIAQAAVALDTGYAYLTKRSLSGSTAPANTVWVNPVLEGAASGGLSTGTGLTTRNNEWSSNFTTGLPSGYSAYAADGTIYQEADAETPMDDGYIHYAFGWGAAGTNISAMAGWTFEDVLPHGFSEINGIQWIKNNSQLALNVPLATPLIYNSGPETTQVSATPGALSANLSIPPVYNSAAAYMRLNSPAGNWNSANAYGAYFTQPVDAYSPAGLGANPGGNLYMGYQFHDSSCWADIGTWNGTAGHAQSRFCLRGSTNANGAGLEWDTWNGSLWSPAFSASGSGVAGSSVRTQGALTGATINGEFTVDGVAYTTINAAWNAAVNQGIATGQNQTVRLGPGTFPVTATLNEPSNGACVSLIGSAGTTVNADSTQIATSLTVPTALNGDVVYLSNTAQAQGCTFKDLNLLAGGNATHGFELQWFRGVLLDNVTVNDTSAEGILLGEENTAAGHQANFTLRNVTVSYSSAAFTPANRPAYGIHLQKTAIDSYLDNVIVRNALTAAVYNEGTGNTGYLIHGFGYPYTCSTAPCANNAASSSASNASYATSYVIYDTGGSGSVWTDTYADSPAIAGFYVGANGVEIHGGHIQWPDLTSFPAANLATVASTVSNNLLIADVDCLEMASGVNWITYAGSSGNPPTYASVHHLTGCGNYYQALEDAEVTGFSSGGANINDPSSATPRVWSTPIAAGSNYPAYAAQMYTGDQGDAFQAHFSGVNPFFNVTYQGTIRTNGGIALNTVISTASALTLTAANKNVIANAASGAQTITLPSCYTPLLDRAAPTGLEFTIVKSDTSSNAVTLQTTNAQLIYNQGASATTLVLSSPSTQTLVCGPDYNWYVAGNANATVTGNAATATALAATPAQCPAGSYATGIAANGTANCSQSWHFTWFGYFGGTFGASTNTSLGAIWSPTAAVNMTRLDIAVGTAPSGCSTYPVIGVYDSTASTWLKTVPLASGTYSYRNAVSGVSIPAGHNLSMGVQTAGVGCTTSPGSAQLTMEYTMNQ
ncbi:MAG: glycosyl hydrolase family 28-related protein, partial [Acidobacteriaceae bacterium]